MTAQFAFDPDVDGGDVVADGLGRNVAGPQPGPGPANLGSQHHDLLGHCGGQRAQAPRTELRLAALHVGAG